MVKDFVRIPAAFLARDVSIASVLSVFRGLRSGMLAVPALPGPLPWGAYWLARVGSCVSLEALLDLFNEPLASGWKDQESSRCFNLNGVVFYATLVILDVCWYSGRLR